MSLLSNNNLFVLNPVVSFNKIEYFAGFQITHVHSTRELWFPPVYNVFPSDASFGSKFGHIT